jgi:hypothetical protein
MWLPHVRIQVIVIGLALFAYISGGPVYAAISGPHDERVYRTPGGKQVIVPGSPPTLESNGKHRGIIAIFGDSYRNHGPLRVWLQDHPLTAAEGAALYNNLINRLPMQEFKLRIHASKMAYNWMLSCKQKGGCHGGEQGKFVDPNAKQFGGKGDEGISIIVTAGAAFVP